MTAASTAVPHGKTPNPAGPTTTGQFSDATHVWTAAGEQAEQLHSLTRQLATTISELADGTATIADRYRSVERRNRLSAQQIEKFLGTAGSSDPGLPCTDSTGAGTSSQRSTSSGYAPSGS